MKCKVGDLAFIVDSLFAENIGAVVRVVGHANVIGADWVIVSDSRVLYGAMCVGAPRITVQPGEARIVALDSELEPITPPSMERTEVDGKVLVTA